MTRDRRPYEPVDNLSIGQIYEVDGNQIKIELNTKLEELTRIYAGEVYAIGQFGSIIQIPVGRQVIFAMVTRLTMKNQLAEEEDKSNQQSEDSRVLVADLFGEGKWLNTGQKWKMKFERGVSTYPLPLQTVYLTENAVLEFIYKSGAGERIALGRYVGSNGIKCMADMNQLLGKHTAILGSTGAGKSATTAAVIHALLKAEGHAQWKPQIVILDPHGEYKAAFPGAQIFSIDKGNLHLPYWMMSGQQILKLIFEKTLNSATNQVPKVERAITELKKSNVPDGVQKEKVNLDSPIPLRYECLIDKIEGNDRNKIKQKLKKLSSDPRKKFIFNYEGEFSTLLMRYFNNEQSPVIMDLSGIPNEIAGLCVASFSSLLFHFKSWQPPTYRKYNSPILLVCEEAHRYVPNAGDAQYVEAQSAIQRIAKEGRKYGIGLFLVSQRPSEIDPTVLSQCNSWIVMRLTNEEDRSKVASILPDSLTGLTKMLSGLRDREAIFAGLAADIPARIRITDLEREKVPASDDIKFKEAWSGGTLSESDLDDTVRRWQNQSFILPKT